MDIYNDRGMIVFLDIDNRALVKKLPNILFLQVYYFPLKCSF